MPSPTFKIRPLFYYAQPILAAVVGVASAWYTFGIPLQEAREKRLRLELEQQQQQEKKNGNTNSNNTS